MMRLCRLTVSIAAMVVSGCSIGAERLPDPRGIRVPDAEVPERVLEGFRRCSTGEGFIHVERINKGHRCRFETKSGSIIVIDEDGELVSIVM